MNLQHASALLAGLEDATEEAPSYIYKYTHTTLPQRKKIISYTHALELHRLAPNHKELVELPFKDEKPSTNAANCFFTQTSFMTRKQLMHVIFTKKILEKKSQKHQGSQPILKLKTGAAIFPFKTLWRKGCVR